MSSSSEMERDTVHENPLFVSRQPNKSVLKTDSKEVGNRAVRPHTNGTLPLHAMRRVRVARIRGTTFGAAEKIRVNVDWTATKLCFIPDTIATSYLLHLDFPSGLFKILPLLLLFITLLIL